MTRCTWPDVSPFFQRTFPDRLEYHASPLAIVLRIASSFICATINTSPDRESVTTAVTSPSASNLGVKTKPSSISVDLSAIKHCRIELIHPYDPSRIDRRGEYLTSTYIAARHHGLPDQARQ